MSLEQWWATDWNWYGHWISRLSKMQGSSKSGGKKKKKRGTQMWQSFDFYWKWHLLEFFHSTWTTCRFLSTIKKKRGKNILFQHHAEKHFGSGLTVSVNQVSTQSQSIFFVVLIMQLSVAEENQFLIHKNYLPPTSHTQQQQQKKRGGGGGLLLIKNFKKITWQLYSFNMQMGC